MTECNTLEDGIYYKVCTSCGEKKVRGCFDRNKSYISGFSSKCKQCSRPKKTTRIYRDKDFAKKQIMRYGHAKI
jgi:hypothetical protein